MKERNRARSGTSGMVGVPTVPAELELQSSKPSVIPRRASRISIILLLFLTISVIHLLTAVALGP